jgi:hypothetical protein
MNLQTFIYIQGALDSFSPRTKQALALKDAKLYFIGKMCLEFALTSPPNLLPCVQNLIGHSSLSLAVCAFNSLYLMLFSNIFFSLVMILICVFHPSYALDATKQFQVFSVEVSTAEHLRAAGRSQ